MENLSQHSANEAIRGFGMNPQVNPAIRSAIRTMSLHVIHTNPENCRIDVTLAKDVDQTEILRHFPEDMHENFAIHVAD